MEAITILAAMDPSTHHLEETFGSSLPQSVTPNGLNAIALKHATEPAVANFFRDSIFCWFRISKCILSDNCTHFINSHVRELYEQYRVDHVKSSLSSGEWSS